MCGFCGYVYFKNKKNTSTDINLMTDVIKHRGPDDEGYFLTDYNSQNLKFYSGNDTMSEITNPHIKNSNFEHNLAFGFRRLSIIDLTCAGHQPMLNQKKDKCIVFNGEIYNHKKYFSFLRSNGYNFNSTSDTEVLLNLYDYYKEKLFQHLNGMFAFSIYDKNKKELILARDRFGIKPLYYYYKDNKFVFASELKSIVQNKDLTLKIKKESIYNYLTYRFLPGEETIYENVYKVLPGYYLKLNLITGDLKKFKYWDLNINNSSETLDEETITNKICSYLENSVERRLVSDVPVGIFLSGGLDSSVIAHLMNKKIKNKVKAFTIGFEEKKYNEFNFADKATNFFNVEHHKIVINEHEFWNGLEKVVYHFDEPVADPAAVPLYYVSKLAHDNGMKVVLCGEGSDEVFAGYTYWKMLKYSNIKKIFNIFNNSLLTILNEKFFKQNFLRKLRMMPILLNTRSATLLFTEEEKKRLLKNYNNCKNNFSENFYKTCFNKNSNLLNKMLYTDIKTWMVDDLLMKADKMTMANSLEVRVPFLDHELVEFAFNFDSNWKIKNNISKFILKKSFENNLPKDLVYRKKMGFPVPWAEWIKNKKSDYVDGILFNTNSNIRDYLDINEIKKIFKLHRTTNIDYCQSIGALLMLEHWLILNKKKVV